MEFDRLRGNWAAQRQQVRQQWSKLTDEDLEAIDGDRNALLNVLEQRYDSPREQLEQQVADFEDRIATSEASAGSQGRNQYEEDSVIDSSSRRDTPIEEQNAGAGSRSNKRNAEQDSAGKQATEQADGTSKTDRQQHGGQKNQQGQKGKQGVPPSWQRQPERRPEQPNR